MKFFAVFVIFAVICAAFAAEEKQADLEGSESGLYAGYGGLGYGHGLGYGAGVGAYRGYGLAGYGNGYGYGNAGYGYGYAAGYPAVGYGHGAGLYRGHGLRYW